MRRVFIILVILLAMLTMATWTQALVIQDVYVLMPDAFLGGQTVNPGPEGVLIHPTPDFTRVYLLENPGFPIAASDSLGLQTGTIIFFITLTGPPASPVTLQVTANVPDLTFDQSVDLIVPSDPTFWLSPPLIELADFVYGPECCFQPHAGTLGITGPPGVNPVTASYTLQFPVPEPSTLLLLGSGLAGLGGIAWKRHRRG